MEGRSLFFDRGKLAGMIALGVLGAALSAWVGSIIWPAALAGQLVAIIVAVAAGIGVAGSAALVILATRRLLLGGEAASYDEECLTVTTLVRTHRWKWNEIEAFGLQAAPPNYILKTQQPGGKMRSYPLIGVAGVDRTVEQWFAEMLQEWPPNKSRAKRLATARKNLGH